MFARNSNLISIEPEHVCKMTKLDGVNTTFSLPKDVAGYSTTTGTIYRSGRNKVENGDQGNPVMLFWESFLLQIDTAFLGRLATAEHMYGAQVNLPCRVQDPSLLYRLFLGSAENLELTALTEMVSENVRKELSRLACRYSPEAFIQGPAHDTATSELTETLQRIYAEQGIGLSKVTLVDISNMIREKEAEYLRIRIDCDARERDVELEQARNDQQRRLDEAAARGDAGAQRAKTMLAGHAAKDAKPEKGRRRASVVADNKKREAQVETEPVLIAGEHDVGGKFALLQSDESPRYYEILRSWFCVGRHENCEVPVSAPGVSALHLTVARIGSGLTLIDHDTTYGTVYNGERITQRFVETGDVYRIGDAWVVFKLEPGQEFRQVDRNCRGSMRMDNGTMRPARFEKDKQTGGRKAADAESAMVELASSAGRFAASDSRPILIGHDSTCDLRLGGGGIGRFHAVICWDAEIDQDRNINQPGVFVEDLHSGRGTKLNGQPVQRAALSDGDTIEISGHRITVSFTGNVQQRAAALAAVTPDQGKLAMTCIEGPDEGLNFSLDPKHADLVLGRDENADIVFTNDEISGRHARITAEMTESGGGTYRPAFSIRDMNSTNGTAVNRHVLKKDETYKLGPGDIVRLGQGEDHCDLLVHFAN